MIRLITVRHGQTTWNTQRRYQGQTDTPLDDVGLHQAQDLARYFAGQTIDALYSSDLQRARCTAQLIADVVGRSPVTDVRLREGSFGAWEGLTYDEIEQRWPHEYGAYLDDPLVNTPPQGENLGQIMARVGTVIEEIRLRHAGQAVMVVAHGGSLRAIICYALKLPSHVFWRLGQDSACVSELRLYDDDAFLSLLNDRHMLNVVSHASSPRIRPDASVVLK